MHMTYALWLIAFLLLAFERNQIKIHASLDDDIYLAGYATDVDSNKNNIVVHGPSYTSDLFNTLFTTFPGVSDLKSFTFYSDLIYGNTTTTATREMSPGVCRLTDYVNECNHDYEGMNNVVGGQDNQRPFFIDFAVTDKPISEVKYLLYSDLQYLPAFGVGIVPIHSIQGFNARNGDPLVLSRQSLSGIFKGNVLLWNDTGIIETNPMHLNDLHSAGDIKVAVMDMYSSLTQVFKKALKSFDNGFASNEYDLSGNPVWNGISSNALVLCSGNVSVSDCVRSGPNRIGFTTLLEAEKENLEFAHILPNTFTSLNQAVSPNVQSIKLAVTENGASFGNDGSNPIRMTADLTNPQNMNSWPIVSYVYFAIRKNTLRAGGDCKIRKNVFDFLTWFYSSSQSQTVLNNYGLSPSNSSASSTAIEIVNALFMCNGAQVRTVTNRLASISIVGVEALHGPLDIFRRKFEVARPTTLVSFTNDQTNLGTTIQNLNSSDVAPFAGFVRASNKLFLRAATANANLRMISYAGYGLSIIVNLCDGSLYNSTYSCPYSANDWTLNLDLKTLGKIYYGAILYWDDPSILSLNSNRTLPHKLIRFIKPIADEYLSFFERIVNSEYSEFATNPNAIFVYSTAQATSKLSETPYSITYTPISDSFQYLGFGKAVSIKNKFGNYISPSQKSLQACSRDTYNITTEVFDLASSMASGCYLFAEEIYLVFPITFAKCSNDTWAIVDFVQWIVDGYGDTIHAQDKVHYPSRNKTDLELLVDVDEAIRNFSMIALFSVPVASSTSPLFRKDGTSAQLNIIEILESITCEGKQMLMVHANLNLIPQNTIIIIYSITGALLLSLIVIAVWIWINRDIKTVKDANKVFPFQVLLGAAVALISIYPMGLQDNGYSFHAANSDDNNLVTNATCEAVPFIYSIGFGILTSGLIGHMLMAEEMLRIYRYRSVRVLDVAVVRLQLVIMLLLIVANAVWAATNNLYWQRVAIFYNSIGEVIGSTGLCGTSSTILVPILGVAGLMIVIMLLGLYVFYRGRYIPGMKWNGFALIFQLISLVIILPVLIFVPTNATERFLGQSISIMIVYTITVALILGPGLIKIHKERALRKASMDEDSIWKETVDEQTAAEEDNEEGGDDAEPNRDISTNQESGDIVEINPHFIIEPDNLGQTLTFDSNLSLLNDDDVWTRVFDLEERRIQGPVKNIAVQVLGVIFLSIEECLEWEPARNGLIDIASAQNLDIPFRFYAEVSDFKRTEDKKSRINKAVNIIRKYVTNDSPMRIEAPVILRAFLNRILVDFESKPEVMELRKKSSAFSMFQSTSNNNEGNSEPNSKRFSMKGRFTRVKQSNQMKSPTSVPEDSATLSNDQLAPVDITPTVNESSIDAVARMAIKETAIQQLSDTTLFQPIINSIVSKFVEERDKWEKILPIAQDSSFFGKDDDSNSRDDKTSITLSVPTNEAKIDEINIEITSTPVIGSEENAESIQSKSTMKTTVSDGTPTKESKRDSSRSKELGEDNRPLIVTIKPLADEIKGDIEEGKVD